MEVQKEMKSLNLSEREEKFFFNDLEVPFYSWECFSILTENRSYDFQILNFKDYLLFTTVCQFLVWKNTSKEVITDQKVRDF